MSTEIIGTINNQCYTSGKFYFLVIYKVSDFAISTMRRLKSFFFRRLYKGRYIKKESKGGPGLTGH